jgi:hypothetical protein
MEEKRKENLFREIEATVESSYLTFSGRGEILATPTVFSGPTRFSDILDVVL